METVQSHCACWQTCPCFFTSSPRDMGTRWVAALLPFNPRIHLCGIRAHWFTPVHSLYLKTDEYAPHNRGVNHRLSAHVIEIPESFLWSGFICVTLSDMLIISPLIKVCIYCFHNPLCVWNASLCWAKPRSPRLIGVTFMSVLRVLMRSGSIRLSETQTFLPLGFTK